MSKYLYGASVQGIQEFIFATNELKSIIGASEIIKNISKTVKKEYEKHIVINAAGNIKLIFDESEKEVLEHLVLTFVKEMKQKAYGITMSQAVVEFEEGNLKKAFEDLERQLFIQRNKGDISLDMSINILTLAQKTARPLVENNLDMSTLLKEKASPSKGNIPKNRKNKTAIIHADGNGLGAMIASMTEDLSDDNKIIKAYKSFSENLEKATVNAFQSAKKGMDEKDIRDVILGGDDMTVICKADDALEFTNNFLSDFEKQTKELMGKTGLTACAGIAYCNHKYPFHYAVNLAESLCNYAKEHSKKINKNFAPSSLMFHNIQSSNFSNYKDYIAKELTLNSDKNEVGLNFGPYFVKEQNNYATITSFRYLVKALEKKGSPVSRLREWLTILGQDATEAKERLLRINDMMELRNAIYNKKALENSLQKFNEGLSMTNLMLQREESKYTPIGDVISHLSVVDHAVNKSEEEGK